MKPWFESTIVYRFRRTDFAPVPGADVVLMRLRKRGPPLLLGADAQAFRDFTTYVFTARQPTVGHTLRGILSARQANIACRDAGILPETTPVHVDCVQWI